MWWGEIRPCIVTHSLFLDLAIVPANHALYARPLRIHGGGVIVSGTDWERFSFANPGASVAEFLRWFDGSLV